MIEIIKSKPDKFIIICDHCDCKFSYDLSDVKKDYYEQERVICPCCKTGQLHSKREREI